MSRRDTDARCHCGRVDIGTAPHRGLPTDAGSASDANRSARSRSRHAGAPCPRSNHLAAWAALEPEADRSYDAMSLAHRASRQLN